MDGESMKALIADADECAESLAYIHPRIRRGAIAAALREAEERGRLKGIEEAARFADGCDKSTHPADVADGIRALAGKTEEKVND